MSTDSNNRAARHLPLQWISRDGWIIILARGLRSFGTGSLGVLLAIYLDFLGLSLLQIGLFLSLTMAGSAFFSFVVALIGDTLGRRRLLILFTALSVAGLVVMAFTDLFLVLAVVAFVGNLNVGGGGGGGPVQPLEMASLPETAPAHKRTELFAIYRMASMGIGALGALSAGFPELYQSAFGISELSAFRVMFITYALLAALGALMYVFLSSAVEVPFTRARWTNPLRLPSRGPIFTMAGLFSVDHFASTLVISTLVALWFHTKFGVELASLAFLFFGFQIMAAISFWLAAKIANRIGLVNTMVFTHIPPTVILIIMPFMPFAWIASILWLVRGFLSMMDIPVRDSYTMAVVAPNERSAMAGIHNVTRSAAGAVSPTIATLVWNTLSSSAPFVMGGGLKLVYLLGFYLMFRNVRPPEEEQRRAEPVQKTKV